jgi:site-specific recombinase XerD
LESIEKERKNCARTRNHRLAVLKTYFSYLLVEDITRAEQYGKIQHITSKREPHRPVEYLTEKEVRSILESIDRTGKQGIRDYALFLTLYNSGARVQELCDLKIKHLRLEKPCMAVLTGKGNKTRHVPLWNTTVEALRAHVDIESQSEEDYVFMGKRGERLSRFGIRYLVRAQADRAEKICPSLKVKTVGPHTFRHTTAMHLLQAGVDTNVIKAWLGHEDLETTNKYMDIDMKMKESALEKVGPHGTRSEVRKILDQEKDVVKWLEAI